MNIAFIAEGLSPHNLILSPSFLPITFVIYGANRRVDRVRA